MSGEEPSRVLPLKVAVQPYAWGRIGEDSLVGTLAASGQPGFEMDKASPYAEMWMGTHPSGPSMVIEGDGMTPLIDWMQKNNTTAGGLPFLFKILSVQTALSIQSHPDKGLAERLHADKPDKYKDANHKPEMTVALTPFEAMCTFKSKERLLEALKVTPELVAVVGQGNVDALAKDEDGTAPFKAALKALFSALMSASKEVVKTQLDALMARLGAAATPSDVDKLAIRLHGQYPGDVGCFCCYLLNYTTLQPGEAMFLAANEPHAYVSGNCAEIMAESDNVIRAGLTPKWMDIETLCSCLTYTTGEPHYVKAEEVSKGVYKYCPPIDEFMLERVQIADGETATLAPKPFVTIILAVSGSAVVAAAQEGGAISGGKEVLPGAVQVVKPQTKLMVTAKGDLLLFRASDQKAGVHCPVCK